ncbi:MAG: carboxypeptidase-like regulatory domain-containing protein [Bacteroidia bacterium]|nr:carboxypeptidase-like regulatory domain-containing protein [Bacteroidia bacterium]
MKTIPFFNYGEPEVLHLQKISSNLLGHGANKIATKLLVLALLSIAGSLWSQKSVLSGYLKDSKTGEALIGATVYKEGSQTGTLTDLSGYYSLELPVGKSSITFVQFGYLKQTHNLDLNTSKTFNVMLIENPQNLTEVTVSSARLDQNITSMDMGVSRLDMKEVSKMPALLGEVDVIKSLQTLPGVSSIGEGASGFNVRGGNIDQNLVLMDEAPVYNSSHLFGFFSVFNPDAVKDLKLYKGSVPAQYGGRASSILDVRMKDGNKKDVEVNGGIGTVFSRLSIEAPVIKDKMGVIVAARRSYLDVVAKPFMKGEMKDMKANFSDFTAKLNWNINEKNNVSLSGYLGRDVFGSLFDFNYGNTTSTLRWNHVYNTKWFSNLTAFYSDYKYYLKFDDNILNFAMSSRIINKSLKKDFSYS